jgi:3-deoxy-manno-octulosonate cytidylyltransferase (CMP-KDO synthetase)
MTEPEVLGVIPARYDSSRFPGKPLAEILGRPMVQWVVEAAEQAETIDRVIVATDDERIADAVDAFGGTYRMTPRDCPSGSDRVARVAEEVESDYVVNIQGDEPLIRGAQLDRGIENTVGDEEAVVGSFMASCPEDELDNPDCVKVVVDRDGRALYFSRASIPHPRNEPETVYQHIGIYIYRSDYLLTYRDWEPTPLERTESLEQLRVLEHGDTIRMTELEEATVGVDRPEDVERVESILRDRESDPDR